MSLGRITIDLLAKTGLFDTSIDRTAKNTARRMKEIERSAKIAGAVIGGALLTGIYAVARATIEAEKAQAQLASRLKDTGGAAGRTLEQLNKMAESLQGRTVFDDEAIAGAQAMLLTFKQIQGTQFDATIEAAADLATVMGTDIADAAKLLGKALTAPEEGFGALKKAGVVFTQSQQDAIKAMVEAGDKAGAQDAILRELSTTMGTAAEAARGTLGGALTGLKNDFENLLEGDGKGVVGVTSAINDLGETMRSPEVKEGFQAIIQGLAFVATWAAKAAAAVAKATQVIGEQVGYMAEEVANGLGAVSALQRGDLPQALMSAKGARDAYSARQRALSQAFAPTAGVVEFQDPPASRVVSPLGGGGAGGGGGGGNSRATSLPSKDGIEEASKAMGDFLRITQELTAELAGPVAQINLDYDRQIAQITATAKAENVAQEELAATIAMVNQQRNAEIQTIEQAAMQVKEFNKEISIGHEMQMRALDDFKFGFANNVEDVLTGAQSIGDAFENMADMVIAQIARMLAQQWTDQLFGGGTSGGGFLSSLFGMFTGGGNSLGGFSNFLAGGDISGKGFGKFATGTNFAPGGMAWVGERGPELVNLPRGSQVIPADRSARMTSGVTQNIYVSGSVDRRSAQQLAQRSAESQRMATARNN